MDYCIYPFANGNSRFLKLFSGPIKIYITYNWKSKKDISDEFVNYYDDESDEPVQGQVKQTNHGFIAQEIKATIDAHPEIKEGHSIWRESPDGVQNVADGALIPMLVKSIQELSAQNAALTARIETLEG